MIPGHPGCATCKLNCAKTTWEPGPDFNYRAKFLFIVEQYKDYIGRSIKKLMRNCGFPDNYEVAYLSRCDAGEKPKAQIREGQACLPLLHRDILDKMDSRTIFIPMGATPTKLVAQQKSVQTCHGSVIVNDAGRIIVPTLHPMQVINYPDSLPDFLKDLEKILDASEGEIQSKAPVKYRLCETIQEVQLALDWLRKRPKVAVDIEATSLDPFRKPWMDQLGVETRPQVLTVNLSAKAQTGFVIPIDHKDHDWQGYRDTVVEMVKEFLEDSSIEKTTHNGQYDCMYLKGVLDITVANWTFDTLLGHYVAVTEEKGTHSLKTLAWVYTDMGGYDDELDAYKAEHPECNPDNGLGHYGNIPLSILYRYAAADADCTFRLDGILRPLVEAEFADLYWKIIHPASEALYNMQLEGAPIDMKWWKHLNEEYPKMMDDILMRLREFSEVITLEHSLTYNALRKKKQERKKRFQDRVDKVTNLYESGDIAAAERADRRLKADLERAKSRPVTVAPITFNPGSPDQKRMLFVDVMGFVITKKTKNGDISTDKEVLKELWAETKHPIVQLIGKWTKMHTLYSMFVEDLPNKIGRDGRLRGGYLLFGTETGRLSCVNPNLQQLPKNPKEDDFIDVKLPSIKKLFMAPKGWVLMEFDYSQAELRVLGSFSDAQLLIDAYTKGEDVHRRVAAEAYEVEQEEVTDQQRHAAKTINFGLLYGQGAAKLAKTIGCSISEAKAFIRVYFDRLPEVKRWISRVKATVREHGYVVSPYGRKRRLASIFSPEQDIVAKAERQAVNANVQNTASDCTLMSIVRIRKAFVKKEMRTRAIMTVHDSIIVLAPAEEAVRAYKIVKHVMETPVSFTNVHWLKVPMVADAKVGKNWGELTEVATSDDLQTYLAANF